MEPFETRFKQVDVLPLVKHYMDELDLFNIFTKYVPAAAGSLADHAESLCILTASLICDNKPLYKVQDWLSQYSDGLVGEPVEVNFFNDDRLARALSAFFVVFPEISQNLHRFQLDLPFKTHVRVPKKIIWIAWIYPNPT